MITLALTEEGLYRLEHDTALHFPHFVASTSFDLEDMDAYRKGTYRGTATFAEFPVAYIHITPKGKAYSIGHTIHILDHTVVDIAGAMDASRQGKSFEINSIGLIAENPDHPGEPYYGCVYAFGSLKLDTYPLPVNKEDGMSFIIPFQVNYGDNTDPHLTAPDTMTPWKEFLDHKHRPVTNDRQVHNLWIDLAHLTLRVDNTTLPIPVQGEGSDIEARISALEDALRNAVHYYPNTPVSSNARFAAVDPNRRQILDSTVKVSSITDSASMASLYNAESQVRARASVKCWARGYRASTNSSGWNTADGRKYKDILLYGSNYLPLYPISVTVIPRSRNYYDYGLKHELWIDRNPSSQNAMYPYLRLSTDASTVISDTVNFYVFILYDLQYYNYHPEDIIP